MNEQLLRERLHAATADIHPVPRLDEILAAPGRSPRRGPAVLAIAAALLVVAAVAAVLALRPASDPSVVTDQPSTTTTSAVVDDRPAAGDAARVPIELLPAGFELIDETEGRAEFPSGSRTYTVLRFAESASSYDAGDPALRVAVLPTRVWVSEMASAVAALERPAPQPGEIVRLDAPWLPTGTADLLPVDDGPWLHYSRSIGPDLLLLVSGRDLDDDTLEAIVAQATTSP